MITKDDLNASGEMSCDACKTVLAGLINAQSTGKLSYQWGDRKIQYSSGAELRQGIADWTARTRAACGGKKSGMVFRNARFSTAPVMTGAEGSEYEEFS